MQNFKMKPGGIHGSKGDTLGLGSKPSWHPRGPVALSRPSNGLVPNLATVKKVPRTQLVPGTVVWAHVPFEDGTGEKTRPAVVVELKGRDLTILPGTTSGRRWDLADKYVEIRDRVAAGLLRPTGIRTTSLTVDIIEVIGVVGRLGDADTSSILCPNSSGPEPTLAARLIPQGSTSHFATLVAASGDAA